MAEAVVKGRGAFEGQHRAVARSLPIGYRTFSRKLAPALTGTGSVLAIMGGLGTWVRAAEVTVGTVGGRSSEEVGAIMGYAQKSGWALAVLSLITLIGAYAWLTERPIQKLVPVIGSLGIVTVVALRLSTVSAEAQILVAKVREAAEAGKRLDLSAYHAGFGWGTWFLILASVLLSLGVIVGVLRELDMRRGLTE